MTIKHASLGIAFPCVVGMIGVFAPLGCSSSKTTTTTTTPALDAGAAAADAGGDAASSTNSSRLSYAGTMTCVDNGGPTVTAPLVLGNVESCIAFTKDAQFPNRLSLVFGRTDDPSSGAGDSLNAQINGVFTKKGDYQTGAEESDTSTFVNITGYNPTPDSAGVHATPGGSSSGEPDCRGACTFSITEAGVLDLADGQKGRVAGTITCTSLAAAGIGCVKCTMAPTVIRFDIDDCLRSD